ncbi:hypothetical protein QBC34DRAFT_478588 [Podospora aff. communis PSN243]|uniref:C2H2-type domain-containing protein n=1 Tax=Podospora aff. communis PSN243 TaxID=3040156 RepID=A0AAV9G355_9PEZI|nr:hypothetical protein QBC34DRAFT_478588 [Podospora aff. communis PSN243]
MSEQPVTTGEHHLVEWDIYDPTLDLECDLSSGHFLGLTEAWPMMPIDAPRASIGGEPIVNDRPIGLHQPLGLYQTLHHDNSLKQSDWDTAHQDPQTFTNPAINATHVFPSHGQPIPSFFQDFNRHNVTAALIAPPTCTHCNKTFSRPDALKRHLKSSCNANSESNIHYRAQAGFTCDLCDPGAKTFKRRDHLLQHLRVYHKMSEGAVERYKIRSGKKTAVDNGGADDGFEE